MRIALLALVLLGTSLTLGCTCADKPDNFYWNSRLVPITGNERVASGTGATERPMVMVAPQPAMP